MFPGADHGMYAFETAAGGERVSTRQPEGYFRMMADFIHGRPLRTRYGDAALRAPAGGG